MRKGRLVRLAPEHWKYLKRRGISRRTAEKNALHTLRQGLGLLAGGPVPKGTSGLVIPYHGCEGYARVRLFPEITNPDESTQKFGQPKDSPARLYVPRVLQEALREPNRSIHIVEGEIKALALTQAGYPAAAIGRVWSWRTKDLTEDGLIPDLETVPGRIARSTSCPIPTPGSRARARARRRVARATPRAANVDVGPGAGGRRGGAGGFV